MGQDIFTRAADVILSRGKTTGRLVRRAGDLESVCALGAIGVALGIADRKMIDKAVLCSLVGNHRHPPEVDELAALLTGAGWRGQQDACVTVYCWSDDSTQEHVRDVLFVLGEGDEDKARQLLAAQEK